MKDALTPVVNTSLDMHFGRLAKLPPEPAAYPTLVGAASRLVRHISNNLLNRSTDGAIDASVQRYIFDRNAALPVWLVNKGLVACQNNRAKLEPAVMHILQNDFNRRRFFDYLSSELLYHCWAWTNEEERKHWIVHFVGDSRENKYCMHLNNYDYVLKFESNIIENSHNDRAVRDWYFRSLGTATLMEFASRPVFDFTSRLVEAKYKKPFILKLFKNIFDKALHGPALGRFGVLVIGDIPKAFGLEEYRNAAMTLQPQAFPPDIGVLELFREMLERFDGHCPDGCCEARFRMGVEPPQSLVNRIAAMYWLRRTLEAAKAIQQRKAVPSRGLLVEERTVLESAYKQKSILYFRLMDALDNSAINPCYIKAIKEESMVLQSPSGNRLNEAACGQEVHGYFAITDRKQKSTYCDFGTNVLGVRAVDANYALVELAFPAAFALTRRTHKRLPLNPSHLASFELSSPNLGADWSEFSALKHWPAPFCIIPDGASQCHIRDLSAGGLMLEINEEAPAYTYFVEGNKDYPLLAFLHLTGQVNLPDLKLGLRLETKSIRDFSQLHKKYVGFQFTEAGEVRRDKLVRFTTVGKDGIFLINDWIFRNTIGH